MESKTKQRIIGACVVVGLVIVLMPLFQGGKDVPAETTLVKAPPFPEQNQQVLADASSDSAIVPDDVIPDRPTAQPAMQAQATESAEESSDKTAAEKTEQPNLLSNRPSIINQTEANLAPTPAQNTGVGSEKSDASGNPGVNAMELAPAVMQEESNESPKSNVIPVPVRDVKTPNKKTMMHTAAAKHMKKPVAAKQMIADKTKMKPIKLEAALGDNGLASIKGSAWVVQIGSFKNKSNALRLVNKLRLNGYHAFMQHVAMTSGENTRVFVGPESQHGRARTLAQRLEADLHVKTIVISYKPLTL